MASPYPHHNGIKCSCGGSPLEPHRFIVKSRRNSTSQEWDEVEERMSAAEIARANAEYGWRKYRIVG